ncbi:serine/threonine protein kinase [Pseudenhygromyxa sp. WMMC2535]|uniref:serine/threonine protein kinase n=1 Tax=Pseudenhygromyxa sp. WMMC2535 TaxID=2712867 RepID=UPI00159630EA|nr:serine/threonine-protein kinase [Pseudenhygromyxa sp. WMMC2535]NVB36228.1 serine/threonine protein kinase [Pseudenhygromyxa sp. WMMC2535]NVB43729.1 serine/threonine protein kinase [Pseudenhygromyxa sp. WMMC2535]NVB43739.1 serine/threonine protein kinase [Pseudenhygromyxa sp. WMMC2535]
MSHEEIEREYAKYFGPDGEDLDPPAEIYEYKDPYAQGPWRALRREVDVHHRRALINAGQRKTIGRFELLRMIGYGGMGVVFRAWDPTLGRLVALKLWTDVMPSGDTRILEEAQALARLSHPNVVSVFDVGEYEGHLYVVMEFIRGQDAAHWDPRHWREVLYVYGQAARGLIAIHEAGLVHNDFKPENLLLGDDERVCVADLGLAASMPRGSESEQRPGGTTGYMAPERVIGGPGDAQSDQFSFCAAVYGALYGALPFGGGTRIAVLEAMEAGKLAAGDRALPGIPPRVRAALLRGLAWRAQDRHPSMEALLAELESAEREALERKTRRRSMWGQVLLGGLLLAFVGGFAATKLGDVPGRESSMAVLPLPSVPRWWVGLHENLEAWNAASAGQSREVYEHWRNSRDILRPDHPSLHGFLSTRVGEQIIAKHEIIDDIVVASWILEGAADAWEEAEAWERASHARHRAASLFRMSGSSEAADAQLKCIAENMNNKKCHPSPQPTVPSEFE